MELLFWAYGLGFFKAETALETYAEQQFEHERETAIKGGHRGLFGSLVLSFM